MADYRFSTCLDPDCGKRFKVALRGRAKSYCSAACKQRGYRRRARILGSVTKSMGDSATYRNAPSQPIDLEALIQAKMATRPAHLVYARNPARIVPQEPMKQLYRDRWGYIHRRPAGTREAIHTST